MAKPSLYSMDPNDSPIYCPFISMDTCNNVGVCILYNNNYICKFTIFLNRELELIKVMSFQ